jgi:hypothetical protein
MFMVGLYRSMDHGHWLPGLRLSVICGNITSERPLSACLANPTVPTSPCLGSAPRALNHDLKAVHDRIEN